MGSVVAVTAASRPLGRTVVARLAADPAVERVVALDGAATSAPTPKLEQRAVEVRDGALGEVLDGVDVVVHVALPDGVGTSDEAMSAVAVDGTRNLLAAADGAGIAKVVHISGAVVYGAHPDNDVPLTEDSPLRANPDFGPGYHQVLAEELVRAWAQAHHEAVVTVLRPVTTLGPGIDDLVTRHLESPRLPLVKGLEPPVQFVHVDDLAAAVVIAATRALPGSYNVAADGWLAVPEVVSLLGRKPLWVPEQVAFSTGQVLWRWGLLPVPPGGLHYLMYPWVVSCDRLRAAGWAPTRSNREILREFAVSHDDYLSLGRVRVRRRRVLAGVAAVVVAGGVAVAAALVRHGRRVT